MRLPCSDPSCIPELICRPIAAQFMGTNLIALFEFESTEKEIKIVSENHYKLVYSRDLSPEELESYKNRCT